MEMTMTKEEEGRESGAGRRVLGDPAPDISPAWQDRASSCRATTAALARDLLSNY
jgi:hypothetical protein